ncbi:class I SAM-dependent methyltransferase [Veillonellaceae bacterium WCA-693-APC-5D-A]|uniref:Class I SAM-dependent methyltransferase n=1 Tax=Anaerovibrio slackiae TaxID=2652309 RepID=A0A6I2UC13_9FIRM|nr:class I SAM-dependent methyltransferase [Anaerovibrio slackiae]MSU09048.1 class I SAM-dependent methyltransferase [Anaerovibrio slackiae]
MKKFFTNIFYNILPSFRIAIQNRDALAFEIQQISELKTQLLEMKEQLERYDSLYQNILGDSYQSPEKENTGTEQAYIQMQKSHYDNKNIPSADIVGQYQWHENFPYETFLLYEYGDVRYPIFESTEDKKALDFACGPGRMIKRMQKWFKEVDGCDIAERLLEEARCYVPEANLYKTNGNDLGDVPQEHYDYIYCTISMQHIASHNIRMKILEQMECALKPGGKIVLQMAYHPDFPYVWEIARHVVDNRELIVRGRLNQAMWMDDDFGAKETNGAHDVGIGKQDIRLVKSDIERYFKNFKYWFANVDDYYENLKGERHGSYWARSWIFIYGEKEM